MNGPGEPKVASSVDDYKCRGCSSTKPDRFFAAQEMMFGMGTTFTYSVCSDCGSAQIEDPDISDKLADYYPDNYYSHQSAGKTSSAKRALLFLKKQIENYEFTGRGVVGGILAALRNRDSLLKTLGAQGVDKTDRVLDVGCGDKAKLLRSLERVGFDKLTGCDPFAASTRTISDNITLHKSSIGDLENLEFDVVLSNHSFEHVEDPVCFFASLADVSGDGALVVIACPTTSSWAFETYQQNWVQLDAPRHLFIPSRDVMRVLADRFGFTLEAVIDNSTSFQVTGSRRYEMGIPLKGKVKLKSSLSEKFNASQKAKRLNKESRGDQCIFVLRKNVAATK